MVKVKIYWSSKCVLFSYNIQKLPGTNNSHVFSQKWSFLSVYDKPFLVDGGDLDSNLSEFVNSVKICFLTFLTSIFIKIHCFMKKTRVSTRFYSLLPFVN